jgi:hypothetical protein
LVFVKHDIRYEPRSRATSHAYGGSTSGSLVDPHARVLSSLVRAPVRLSPRTRAMTLHTGSANQTTQSIGGDFGDDAATLARAAAWRRENPELAEREAGRVLPPPLGQPRRRREEGDAAGARALTRPTTLYRQARVRHLRPRLHVAPRVPML